MQQLEPKAVWLFFFSFIIRVLFLLIILGYFFFLAAGMVFFRPYQTEAAILASGILLTLGIGSIAIILVFLYFWAVLTYKNYKYQLTDDVVKIERGVIWKRYVSIPYERIQNVDIHRGIFARLLGLSDLQVQTAGLSGGSFLTEGRLPGLSVINAEKLRDELIQRVKGTKQGL